MINITKYLYALDLSMSCTGLTIFDLGKKVPILISHIKPNPKETHGERLHEIREFLKDMTKRYAPYEVAIEQGFSMHARSTQATYRCHGVINEFFHEYEQFYYAPTTVKKLVSNNGRSSKEILQASILERYPDIKFANTDESDSFGVGITHLVKVHKMKW